MDEATLIGPNGQPYTVPSYSSNVPALYDRSGLYGPDLGHLFRRKDDAVLIGADGLGMPVPAYYDKNVLYGPSLGELSISTGTLLVLAGTLFAAGGVYWLLRGKKHRRKGRR